MERRVYNAFQSLRMGCICQRGFIVALQASWQNHVNSLLLASRSSLVSSRRFALCIGC